LRLKPRFPALQGLVRIRSGKGVRRKRKGPGSNDPAAAAHEAHEREIALNEQRGAQACVAHAEEVPGPDAERETGLFSWFDRLVGKRRPPSGAAPSHPAQGPGLRRADPEPSRRPAADAPARGGIPAARDAGIFPHLLKLGLVSGAHWRATLFGHVPQGAAGIRAPARLLRRPLDEQAAASPVGLRLRGLLGGVGQWKAGLRGLLRDIAALLNGARAVLGCWFEAGRFHAARASMVANIGVRAWVFP
jgi:hypothetical protein